METETRELWTKQNRHEGDRARLFHAVQRALGGSRVLYPGSFVDVAPSFAWPSVTYVDSDDRAARFFADSDGVTEIMADHDAASAAHQVRFVHADYTDSLPLDLESFDFLVSLYAGFVSEHCTQYLRVGGSLLVNPSHGDAAMASIDSRYRLQGVVTARSGRYAVVDTNLSTYLVPRKPVNVTVEHLHATGRGIGYTKSPFAYLFERVQ